MGTVSGSSEELVVSDVPVLSRESSSSSSGSLYQPTISKFLDVKNKFKPGDQRSKEITRKIGHMICKDNQPFSIVEDDGFKKLIEHLEPRYTMPTRKHMANFVIPELFREVEARVKVQLQEAESVAITTDLWTSTACDDYLSVTVHFIDNNFQLRHICIEVIPFEEVSHTGANISQFLTKTLQSWNLLHKLVAVIHDNGRNVVNAMNLGNFPHLSCLAHTFQLVVKDGVLSSKNIQNLIALCRKLVGSFKHSSKSTKILKAAQQHLSLPQHRLIQDEPTRWNSTMHMLQRLQEQKRAIIFASADLNLAVQLTTSQWLLTDDLIKILTIFDQATFTVSSSSVTVSEVIPIVNSVISALGKLSLTGSGICTAKQSILEALNRRYGAVEEDEICSIATLLDPRLKDRVFVSQGVVTSAKERLLNLMNQEENAVSSSDKVSSLNYFCF